MESYKIYLCKADCSILGNISGIKIETCSLKKHAVEQWEITFDVERYTNDNSCELKQSDYYDSINTMMRLYLDGKEQVYFVIDSEPVIKGEGLQEVKTVTAHSIECELNEYYLTNFKINCGTKDSQEYLATDSNGNFNNINSYTNLPYEYISLVNYDNPQLSLLHLALQNTGWTVADNIDKGICEIKKNYDISNTSIYSFFMSVVSSSAFVIFQFDRKYKKVGLVKADNFGEDTGIFVTMRNLMKRFEISASSNDELITRLYPTGADNLGIEQVNWGKNYITNLDYFMNTLNEYGDYKYVSKELHDKYTLWKNYRESDKVTFNGKQCTRREQYIELSKLYNQTVLDINDLKNRVPNDGAITDYKTFSLDELKLHLNAFNKALVSLITIYKNEYGVTEIGDAPNYTPTPSSAVNIKDTPYWHDYYAYQESIIPQIKEALKMYCQTDSNGNLMTDINGHFIEMEFGNPAYYADPSIVKEVDAYKYEWSLYGLDELESKKKAWCEVANLLFNDCFILSGTIASPTAYRTPDDNGWNSLSDAQKKEFTSKSAYVDKLNQYLDYMSFDTRNNSLTKTNCKGIIRQCEDAIVSRKNEIASLEILQNNYQTQRKELANSVAIENFKVNNVILFTEQDLNVINGMIREKDYNNSNIITTNLDDIVTSIDTQEELYQAAVEEIYKLSQPQYSFSTDMENLYALEEFQCYHDDFEVGNLIRAGFEIHEELFDNEFIKLRLMSITYNPLDLSSQDISVEFSTMTKELNGVSDLASLLGENNSSSNSSSGSSFSGSSGTYGNNDANVQMSNNMINALLSTGLFGTTVTDVILDSIKGNKGNFNTLLSHSGVFDSLEAGRIKVSGDCLFDWIKSSNYIEGESGSFLDLLNGNFDFAGGRLKWDGKKLSVDGNGKFTGDIVANSLKLGQSVKIDNKNISGLSKVATSGDFNDLFNTSDILMTDNVSIETATDNITGITTKTITVGSKTYTTKESDNYILTNVGLGVKNDEHSNSYFKVSKEGLLEANNAVIYGTVYATNGEFSGTVNATSGTFNGAVTAITLTANQSGTIAGWNFNENGFYKNNSDIATNNGMYFGNNGISISDYFVVNKNGLYFKSKNFNVQHYDTEIRDMKIKQDEYIRVYLYNMGSTEYFNLSFQYSYNQIIGNSSQLTDAYSTRGWGTDGRTTPVDSIMEYDGNDVKIFYQPYSELFPSDATSQGVYNLRCYSYGRTMEGQGDKWFAAVQIGKIEICDSNGTVLRTYNGTLISDYDGFMINSYTKHIISNGYFISNENFIHKGVYSNTTTASANVFVNSGGHFMRSSSSSRRYKTDINVNIPDNISPQKLYDFDIVSYKYKNNYLMRSDQRYNKDIIGFIAEDIYAKYPIACNLDEDGNPEMWNINVLFPAALKLIQEQHKEIDKLKEELESMKQQFQGLKTCIIN